jgi:hypothetical protein
MSFIQRVNFVRLHEFRVSNNRRYDQVPVIEVSIIQLWPTPVEYVAKFGSSVNKPALAVYWGKFLPGVRIKEAAKCGDQISSEYWSTTEILVHKNGGESRVI